MKRPPLRPLRKLPKLKPLLGSLFKKCRVLPYVKSWTLLLLLFKLPLTRLVLPRPTTYLFTVRPVELPQIMVPYKRKESKVQLHITYDKSIFYYLSILLYFLLNISIIPKIVQEIKLIQETLTFTYYGSSTDFNREDFFRWTTFYRSSNRNIHFDSGSIDRDTQHPRGNLYVVFTRPT